MLKRIAFGLAIRLAIDYSPALAVERHSRQTLAGRAIERSQALPEGPEMFDLPNRPPRVDRRPKSMVPVSRKQPITQPTPLIRLSTPVIRPLPPSRDYLRLSLAIPLPWVSVKTGYWCADSEAVKGFLVNSDSMHTAEIEIVPFATDAAFRFSGNFLNHPSNSSAHFWDAALRWKRLELGIRQEALRTVHASSLFLGTNGALPLPAKFLQLEGELLWGPTFAHVPEKAPNRLIVDWSLRLACSPNESFTLSLGYRDYFFGTANDLWGVATISGPRSAYFGSYEGPLTSLDFLF